MLKQFSLCGIILMYVVERVSLSGPPGTHSSSINIKLSLLFPNLIQEFGIIKTLSGYHLSVLKHIVRKVVVVDVGIMQQTSFQLPRHNPDENVVEPQNLRVLHSNVDSLGRHHREEKSARSYVRREKPVRVFVQRDVPLAAVDAKWHRVVPDVAGDGVTVVGRFDGFQQRDDVLDVDEVAVL